MTDDTKNWLNSQHPWLQEATYRILSKGKVDEADVPDLVKLIKDSQLQADTSGSKDRTYPDFGSGSVSPTTLRLTSIGDVVGIESLEPKQPLTFGNGNLTVVYGNNGSGKSGYIRILKKASGKAGATALKPNVYKPAPDKQLCTITVNIDGKNHPTQWAANSLPIPILSPLDIFDTTSGRIYMEGSTEATYKPAELVLLTDLATISKKVDAALEEEQGRLPLTLPEMPAKYSGTVASYVYGTLTADVKNEELSLLLPWSENDEQSLNQLTQQLSVKDPVAAASQRRSVKMQLDSLSLKLQTALSAITTNARRRLQELTVAAKRARQAATEGAKVMTPSSELEGVASATWRSLWEAARAYSTLVAYPDRPYPNVETGARCVLCQRELDTNEKQRFRDFENYVSGALEATAIAAENLANKALAELPDKVEEEILRTQCQAAELAPEVTATLVAIWSEVNGIAGSLRADPLDETIKVLDEKEHPLIAELTRLAAVAENAAQAFDKDAVEFNRKKIEEKVLELAAKQWTSLQADAINNRIAMLKKRAEFVEWRKKTDTRELSKHAGRVSEALITGKYVERFNAELGSLGASKIKVELVKVGVSQGHVRHQIQLRGLTAAANLGEVLSEGESRIVSLAAFLADVTGKPSKAPFIFDDPISSLDHDYEWQVATRLAALASERQVVVFTHRLSLYGSLEDAARKVGDSWKTENLCQLCIEAFGGSHGHPVDGPFWSAATKKANNLLLDRLRSAKIAWDAGDSASYKSIAQGICSDFRKLLERTIEEDLLSKVVLRHRRSVTTENRIKMLAKITSADCAYFDDLMTKYSCYEHSQSTETPVALPDEPDLRADVEGLKTWRESFASRV